MRTIDDWRLLRLFDGTADWSLQNETLTFRIPYSHAVDTVTVEWAGLLGRKKWTTTKDANGRSL